MKLIQLVSFVIYVIFARINLAQARTAPAQLQFTGDFILKQILIKKNLAFRPELELPKLFLESTTPLLQFQDAIFPQWGFRPEVFTNAYSVGTNEIYLLDEAKYYTEKRRCMDDSYAHELTHYVQSQYQKYDLNDESLEWDAVEVQTWFREAFCQRPQRF